MAEFPKVGVEEPNTMSNRVHSSCLLRSMLDLAATFKGCPQYIPHRSYTTKRLLNRLKYTVELGRLSYSYPCILGCLAH